MIDQQAHASDREIEDAGVGCERSVNDRRAARLDTPAVPAIASSGRRLPLDVDQRSERDREHVRQDRNAASTMPLLAPAGSPPSRLFFPHDRKVRLDLSLD